MERIPKTTKPNLILLVDKQNLLGDRLSAGLEALATVVLVTREKVIEDSAAVFVPFSQSIPQIPEGDYTHALFVWDKDSEHLLEPLARKAQEWGVHLYVVAREGDKESVDVSGNENVTLLVLGDVFGAREKFPLDKFLESAKSTKRIKLSGMGLHEWRPILFTDAIKTIVEVILSKKRGDNFLVGPSHAMTALGIAHLLQKIDPEVLIDFSGTEDGERGHGMPSLLGSYDSAGKLKEYYQMLVVRYKKDVKESGPIIFSKKSEKNTKKKGIGLYFMYMLIIFLVLPFALTAIGGGLGALFLSSGIQDSEKGRVLDGLQKIKAAEINFSLAQSSLAVIDQAAGLLFPNDPLRTVRGQLSVSYELSQVADDSVSAGKKLSDILAGKTVKPKEDAEEAVGSLKHAFILLSNISDQDVPSSFRQLLQDVKKCSSLGSGVVDELPQVLGVTGEKKYLVLFQNNMELRPGGGFIGSYGLLTLRSGAVKDFTIHDVYDADGQLKGHVEPPFAIRRYVPIVHLYLRDSNFDPDFLHNAQTAAFMLSQETGDKVDGVVGIDLEVLKGLLAGAGSVYVPSYNQTVNEQNFFQLLEEHAEKNFFPGSTQKKDFLNTFASALMLRMQQGLNGRILLEKIVALVAQKHIAVGFSDPSIQMPFSLTGLSGTLLDVRASQSGVLNDFLGVVEANLGINKANAFVTRKLSQQINIQDNGDVDETVTMTLSNNSDGTWPGGAYRNYARFILPKNAVLNSVSLDNVNQQIADAVMNPSVYEAKSFIEPRGLEVAKEEEQGKVLYGFLVTVPEKKSLVVTFSYTIPHAFSEDDLEQTYSLFVWKQMGVNAYPYDLSISFPDSLRLLSSSKQMTQQDQTLHYTGSVAGDAVMTFSFSRK